MTKKDNLNKCLLEDVSKIKFKGIYVPNLYVFDKDLNSNMKLILFLLLYINKYYHFYFEIIKLQLFHLYE